MEQHTFDVPSRRSSCRPLFEGLLAEQLQRRRRADCAPSNETLEAEGYSEARLCRPAMQSVGEGMKALVGYLDVFLLVIVILRALNR